MPHNSFASVGLRMQEFENLVHSEVMLIIKELEKFAPLILQLIAKSLAMSHL
jgi:hypothetical protein